MKTRNNYSPLISVVIPIYNGEKTILNTLSSVINQTHKYLEIIIVDDGSNYPVELFLQNNIHDSRIKVYRIEHSNANVARNYGIEKSNGEYISMLDADDYWLENHLTDCLNLLIESNADGLYGSILISKEQSIKIEKAQILYAREPKKGESIIDYLLSKGCGAQTSTLFTTRLSMKDIQWDTSLIDHQDYDFVTRFYKKYMMIAKREPTVLYSLASGREPHYETCIQYVEQNKQDINPAVYTEYHKKIYVNALRRHASEKIIAYFRKEATRYKEYLSYRQYLVIKNPETFYQALWEKVIYLIYILRLNFKIV